MNFTINTNRDGAFIAKLIIEEFQKTLVNESWFRRMTRKLFGTRYSMNFTVNVDTK